MTSQCDGTQLLLLFITYTNILAQYPYNEHDKNAIIYVYTLRVYAQKNKKIRNL